MNNRTTSGAISACGIRGCSPRLRRGFIFRNRNSSSPLAAKYSCGRKIKGIPKDALPREALAKRCWHHLEEPRCHVKEREQEGLERLQHSGEEDAHDHDYRGESERAHGTDSAGGRLPSSVDHTLRASISRPLPLLPKTPKTGLAAGEEALLIFNDSTNRTRSVAERTHTSRFANG